METRALGNSQRHLIMVRGNVRALGTTRKVLFSFTITFLWTPILIFFMQTLKNKVDDFENVTYERSIVVFSSLDLNGN